MLNLTQIGYDYVCFDKIASKLSSPKGHPCKGNFSEIPNVNNLKTGKLVTSCNVQRQEIKRYAMKF